MWKGEKWIKKWLNFREKKNERERNFRGKKKKMNVKKNQKFRTSLFDVIDLIVLKRSYWILYMGIFYFKIIQFKKDNHLINSIDMDTNFNNFFYKITLLPS